MPSVPTFALLTTRMEGWYQSQVWHGAGTAARMLGARVVALIGSAFEAEDQTGGPVGIFDLAQASEFDGYLVLSGALANFSGIAPIESLLDRLPYRPVVCIGQPVPGTSTLIPGQGGMDAIARHLIGVHGLKRMAFIRGPSTNADAQRRWNDWNLTLAEYGLSQDLDLVELGDFMPTSAEMATRRILDRAPVPQAFVCANDAMASGVRKVLAERGVRIPQDTILTGFDDIEESSTMIPPLTTIRVGTYQMAFRGIELLMEQIRGAPARTESIDTQIVLRRSCGCHGGTSTTFLPRRITESAGLPTPAKLLQMLTEPGSSFLQLLEETLDLAEGTELDLWEEHIFLAARLSGSGRISPELLAAQTLVSQARHGLDTRRRQELHQLMRTQFQAIQSLDFEVEHNQIPQRLLHALKPFAANHLRMLLFRDDLQPVARPDAFRQNFALSIDAAHNEITRPDPTTILPPNDEGPGTWATLALSLGSEHYGVIQVSDWNSNELFLESLRLSLTMVLSVYRKSARESEIREKLLALSRRDDLTGLLNRRGLLEQGEILVRSALRLRKHIGVVLCDLDGLKGINDEYGHQDGDLAILCLARSLEDGFRQSDVICRLGGDEFAVVTLIEDESSLEGAIRRLRQALERRSEELGRPWKARTSAGWTSWTPGDGRSLEQVLAEADQTLYQDKRSRRGTSTF